MKRSMAQSVTWLALLMLVLCIGYLSFLPSALALRYSLEPSCGSDICKTGDPMIWDVRLYSIQTDGVVERLVSYTIRDARFDRTYYTDVNQTWLNYDFGTLYRRLELSVPHPNVGKEFVYNFCYKTSTLFEDKRAYTNEFCVAMNHSLPVVECRIDAECSAVQTCEDGLCVDIACDNCSYIEDRVCVPHECCESAQCTRFQACVEHRCEDLLCGAGEYLVNHTCAVTACLPTEGIVDFACVPLDCAWDEGYVNHECVKLGCHERQAFVNHTCVDLLCTVNQTWVDHTCVDLACRDDEFMSNHECVPLQCNAFSLAQDHECRLDSVLLLQIALMVLIAVLLVKNILLYQYYERKALFDFLWHPFDQLYHKEKKGQEQAGSKGHDSAEPRKDADGGKPAGK